MKQVKNANVKKFGVNIQAPLQTAGPAGRVRCHSTEYETYLQNKFPNRASNEEFEAWLAPKVAEVRASRMAGKNIQQIYNIPVVIHIIHNGDAIGTGENITSAQAISQINVLNEDYRRMAGTNGGANTTGLAVDCEINFCLAQTDPSGNPTTGVVRHNITPYSNNVADGAGGADWETMADVEAMKAATQWNPDEYLNFWIIRPGGQPLQFGGLNGLLGYAQFPNSSGLAGLNANNGAANTDGLVCAFDAMGTIAEDDGTFILNGSYNLGRTMTHEAGHWLGLRHLWGDGDCTVDDFCADTPNCDGDYYNCASISQCGNQRQYQNYMDYTYDTCMDTFTQDQKDRMVAVMTNSPRRGVLNSSIKCSPAAPFIKFNNDTGSVNEETNCLYTDYTFPVTIALAPSADATVTFNVIGGSAVQGNDYSIVTNPVVFLSGSTNNQDLTLRVYNDGKIEGDETIIIQLSLSTAGDAQIDTSSDTMTITISDNDINPSPSNTLQVFYEDFEDITGWTVSDEDGDGDDWGLFDDSARGQGQVATSASWNNVDGALTPDNWLISPAISLAGISGNIELSWLTIGQDQAWAAENYTVYVATNNTVAALQASTTNFSETLSASGNLYLSRTLDISSFAGQTIYVAFRHHAVSDQFRINIDDVLVSTQITTNVQVNNNIASPQQIQLNGLGNTIFYDASSSDIMLGVNVNDSNNYGCTSVAVSRDQTAVGAAAAQYGASVATIDYAMAKQFTITPSSVVSGSSTITFYFTENEVAAWESFTANSRTSLYVVKDNGSQEVQPCSVGAFGSEVTLTASFSTGIDGVFTFARQQSLPAESFELTGVALYPNPNNGLFNLDFNATSGNVNVDVYDVRGRLILNKNFSVNGLVNETIELNNAQSGIYLVTIQDGERKITKKIVVE